MLHFDKLCDFNDNLIRNIVSLRKSEDLFDDLHDKEEMFSDIAVAAESRVKSHISSGHIERAFHYTTSVGYPFETDNYLLTRYGDGSYPVWYGSLDLKTTIYETAYHMLKAELGIEGLNEIVIRERAIYDVHCEAALIDLTHNKEFYRQLTAENYDFTQPIGRRIHREGQPGLIAPSARHRDGKNAVIFNKKILSNPRLKCYLTYKLNPVSKEIAVERTQGKTWLIVRYK